MKSGPHLPQLEKALTQKQRPNTAKNKYKNKLKKKKDLKKKYVVNIFKKKNIYIYIYNLEFVSFPQTVTFKTASDCS